MQEKSNPSLDIECFKSFAGDDIEQQKVMIELFLSQSQTYFAELSDSLQFNIDDDWHDTAHKLKGMSSFCGAHNLYNLCKNAEDNYCLPQSDKQIMLHNISTEIENVNLAFQDYLKEV